MKRFMAVPFDKFLGHEILFFFLLLLKRIKFGRELDFRVMINRSEYRNPLNLIHHNLYPLSM